MSTPPTFTYTSRVVSASSALTYVSTVKYVQNGTEYTGVFTNGMGSELTISQFYDNGNLYHQIAFASNFLTFGTYSIYLPAAVLSHIPANIQNRFAAATGCDGLTVYLVSSVTSAIPSGSNVDLSTGNSFYINFPNTDYYLYNGIYLKQGQGVLYSVTSPLASQISSTYSGLSVDEYGNPTLVNGVTNFTATVNGPVLDRPIMVF